MWWVGIALDTTFTIRTSMSGSKMDGDAAPAFEMVVLGSGGGPLETDSSGWVSRARCHDVVDRRYLVKPYHSRWEDGILALEGGTSWR